MNKDCNYPWLAGFVVIDLRDEHEDALSFLPDMVGRVRSDVVRAEWEVIVLQLFSTTYQWPRLKGRKDG